MDIDDARVWLDELAENLLDGNYTVAGDAETHQKIAAIRAILTRHEALERGLSKLDSIRDEIGGVIGPLL